MWHCIFRASRIFPDGAGTTSGAAVFPPSFPFKRHLLRTHSALSSLLSAGNSAANETDEVSGLTLSVSYGNNQNKDINERD